MTLYPVPQSDAAGPTADPPGGPVLLCLTQDEWRDLLQQLDPGSAGYQGVTRALVYAADPTSPDCPCYQEPEPVTCQQIADCLLGADGPAELGLALDVESGDLVGLVGSELTVRGVASGDVVASGLLDITAQAQLDVTLQGSLQLVLQLDGSITVLAGGVAVAAAGVAAGAVVLAALPDPDVIAALSAVTHTVLDECGIRCLDPPPQTPPVPPPGTVPAPSPVPPGVPALPPPEATPAEPLPPVAPYCAVPPSRRQQLAYAYGDMIRQLVGDLGVQQLIGPVIDGIVAATGSAAAGAGLQGILAAGLLDSLKSALAVGSAWVFTQRWPYPPSEIRELVGCAYLQYGTACQAAPTDDDMSAIVSVVEIAAPGSMRLMADTLTFPFHQQWLALALQYLPADAPALTDCSTLPAPPRLPLPAAPACPVPTLVGPDGLTTVGLTGMLLALGWDDPAEALAVPQLAALRAGYRRSRQQLVGDFISTCTVAVPGETYRTVILALVGPAGDRQSGSQIRQTAEAVCSGSGTSPSQLRVRPAGTMSPGYPPADGWLYVSQGAPDGSGIRLVTPVAVDLP